MKVSSQKRKLLPKSYFGEKHFIDYKRESADFAAFFGSFPNLSQIPKNIVFQNHYVMGQASISFFEAMRFEFCISENGNKIPVLLSKMQGI